MMRSILAALALTLADGGSAHAQQAATDPLLGLSNDGVTWTEALTEPLFDSSALWVPGDARQATFYVRNATADEASLAIEAVFGEDAGLASDLVVRVRIDDGGWQPVDIAPSAPASSASIPGGDSCAVHVQVVLPFSASNRSETQRVNLALRVTLTQIPDDEGTGGDLDPDGAHPSEDPGDDGGAAGGDPPTGGSSTDARLPTTGLGSPALLLVTAAGVTGAGIMAIKRRREESP